MREGLAPRESEREIRDGITWPGLCTPAGVEGRGDEDGIGAYRALFDHALNGVAVCDLVFVDGRAVDFRYVDVNAAFERLTGVKNAKGRLASELFPGINQRDSSLVSTYARVVETGEPVRFERYVETLGQWFAVSAYAVSRARFVAAFDVITDQKKTLEELRSSEERYRTLVENIDDLVVTFDEAGAVTFASPAVRRFGYEPEEVVGRAGAQFLAPKDRVVLERALALPPDGHHDLAARVVTKDGGIRFVRARVRRHGAGPNALTALVTDRTDERVAEQQQRAAQRAEALGRLTGGIAHDFNNLLGVILAYCELAAASLPETVAARDEVDEIRRTAMRARDLTQQLLAFGRRQVLVPEVLALEGLVDDMARMLQRTLSARIDVVVRHAPNVRPTKVDRVQIEQVVLNLAVNAADAMPEGGRLSMTTENTRVDEAHAEALDVAPGDYVLLTVVDEGTGMTDSVRAQAFEPFFTTKPVGRGSGLGLATAFGIARQSGGTITLESDEGHGTTARVFLPATEDRPTPRRTTPPPMTAVGRGERVMLVEDEPALRVVLVRALRAQGFVVEVAANATEALKLCGTGPRFALVLTDVVMPGPMSGRDLAEHVAEVCPATKILFMSGYSPQRLDEEGLRGNLLQKPFDLQTLVQRVREIIDQPSALGAPV